jgi:hypothetical protein
MTKRNHGKMCSRQKQGKEMTNRERNDEKEVEK